MNVAKCDLSECDAQFSFLNSKLRPIAERTVDTSDPDWPQKFASRPHPLDEAGVRAKAESLLAELAELYAEIPSARRGIRNLFSKYRSASWALGPSQQPTTPELFRFWVLVISMKDQYADGRDTLLELLHICRVAAGAGVEIGPILESVATISSDDNPYGMGSLRSMLLDAPRRYVSLKTRH
jgi:hypothetical protein